RSARAAFGDFRGWRVRAATPAAGDGYGCGPELFDCLLARGHWSARTPGDLLAEAHAGLEEALARVDEQARASAAHGWPEVQARLADLHPSAAEYLREYQRIWDGCRDCAGAAGLLTWPVYPIRYVPIPPHTRDAAPFVY